MRKARTIGMVSETALEDEWQRRATAAAIEAARGVIAPDGPIPPTTPIGRLSDGEWGWVVAAVLFGWIRVRAEQATAEQLDTEQCIHVTARRANAAAGGPLMTPDEWNDEIGI